MLLIPSYRCSSHICSQTVVTISYHTSRRIVSHGEIINVTETKDVWLKTTLTSLHAFAFSLSCTVIQADAPIPLITRLAPQHAGKWWRPAAPFSLLEQQKDFFCRNNRLSLCASHHPFSLTSVQQKPTCLSARLWQSDQTVTLMSFGRFSHYIIRS